MIEQKLCRYIGSFKYQIVQKHHIRPIYCTLCLLSKGKQQVKNQVTDFTVYAALEFHRKALNAQFVPQNIIN